MKAQGLSAKAVLVASANGFRALGDIILAILLVRLLSQTDYGSFRQVILVLGTISIVSSLGLPASVYYYLPRLSGQMAAKFLNRLVGLLLVTGSIAIVVCFGLAPLLAWAFSNPSLTDLLRIAAIYPMGQTLTQVVFTSLVARNRHASAARWMIILSVVQVLMTAIPAIAGWGLTAVVMAASAFWFLVSVVSIIRAVSWRITGTAEEGLAARAQMLKYSVPLSLNSTIGSINQRVDRYLVSFFYGPSVFAVFSVGAVELPLVNILPYSIGSMLVPEFARLDSEGRRDEILRIWHEAIRRTAIVIMPIFCLCLLFASDLIRLLYTESYESASLVFRVYLLLLPFRVANYGGVLQALGATREILYGAVIGFAANCLLGVAFLWTWGWTGPAWASIAAQIVIATYLTNRIGKHIATPWRRVFPIRQWLSILGSALLALVLTLPVFLAPVSLLVQVVAAIVILGASYGAILWISNLLDRRDLALAKDLITLSAFK